MDKQELTEQLAEKEHGSWSHWIQYLFERSISNFDGSVTLPGSLVSLWTRQMTTSYTSLSEQEKQSDRNRVNLILPLIEAYLAYEERQLLASLDSIGVEITHDERSTGMAKYVWSIEKLDLYDYAESIHQMLVQILGALIAGYPRSRKGNT